MKILSNRGNIIQATVFSFIGAFIILVVGMLSLYLTDVSELITLSSFFHLLINKPLLWVMASYVLIIPLTIYLIYYKHTEQIENLNTFIGDETKKSNEINNYVSRLIQEDFDTEVTLSDTEDKLSKSLIRLRESMKNNKEIAEKRRNEDEIRRWSAEGMAKFGEILRSDNDNLEKLAYNVVKNLSDYIGAIQGGFYLLRNEDEANTYFELIAFYAFGRKKFADQHIKWGVGIIGTCSIERKLLYITDVPDSYMNVTSGLGKSNPRSMVVAPLIANEELFGVIEIASLQELEKHQIDFVERVSESTASILSAVKMNMQTSRLLQESKAQTQALASQEEEMRQNMEELQATQEEAARQAQRFMRLETTVNHTMLRAEYTTDGILIYANTKFLHKLEYSSNSEVEGKNISMFISKKDEEWFKRIWHDLASGGRHYEGYMKHVTKSEKDLWTMATYTCIRNEEGDVERILFLGIDTTEQKKLSLNLEGIVDAVNRASIKIVFDINGNIKEHNESFLYLFKYSEKDIARLTVFDLIDTLELELFNKKWENIVRGMNFQGQFKVKSKTEEEKWIRGAFSSVYNMYGEVERVVYIGSDITNEKLMEIESKKQNEILKKQERLLRESEKELNRKLREAKQEMKEQFKAIEQIKIRNERTLEGALDAIITTSHDNKIIFFNTAAERLLEFSKEEVMGKNIGILFESHTIDQDSFLLKYTGPGDHKIIGQRKEIKIRTKNGIEKPVLILLSKAHVEKETTYTAFIQTIEVELF
jgi:PAS domain S-box-containing protein